MKTRSTDKFERGKAVECPCCGAMLTFTDAEIEADARVRCRNRACGNSKGDGVKASEAGIGGDVSRV